jgi:hypothetical protein
MKPNLTMMGALPDHLRLNLTMIGDFVTIEVHPIEPPRSANSRRGYLRAQITPKGVVILAVQVPPCHRRQGPASYMLATLERFFGPASYEELTPMGRCWWEGIGRSETDQN